MFIFTFKITTTTTTKANEHLLKKETRLSILFVTYFINNFYKQEFYKKK